MKVALIHAMISSIKPIESAFIEVAPDIERLHFMDTGLLPLIEEDGELTPRIIRRFSHLVNIAADTEIDAIQLSCSAFNNVTSILQPLYSAKMFRSDEAMLDKALEYNRIGLIATANETPSTLKSYLYSQNKDVHVQVTVNRKALEHLQEGRINEHDKMIEDMIREIEKEVDVIVLAQYSMAHVVRNIDTSVPVLTGPLLAAKRCYEYLLTISDSN